jgi:hypothetical protein
VSVDLFLLAFFVSLGTTQVIAFLANVSPAPWVSASEAMGRRLGRLAALSPHASSSSFVQ